MDTNPIDAQGMKIQVDQPAQPPPVRSENAANKAPASPQPPVDPGLSIGETKAVVESLEGLMDILQTSLGFIVDQERDKIFVTITNRETNEVIRQIPPEELVVLQEKMKELTGIIFNEIV